MRELVRVSFAVALWILFQIPQEWPKRVRVRLRGEGLPAWEVGDKARMPDSGGLQRQREVEVILVVESEIRLLGKTA